jgi:hypothetical protein
MAVTRRRGVLAAVGTIVCLGVCLSAAGAALAAEDPSYLSSFGPDGTESTGFAKAGPITVDQGAGLIYVIDHSLGTLSKFDLEGSPVPFGGSAGYISGNTISGLSLFPGNGESQVAVDSASHIIYVTSANSIRAFQPDGEPSNFTAGPSAGTSEIGGFTELLGVAVDESGNIYAADYAGVVSIYAPSGELITQFAASAPANLAVAPDGAVYVNSWHGTVTKYTPSDSPVSSTTLYTAASEPLDPSTSYTVAVDPATGDVYIAENEGFVVQIARYDKDGVLLGTFAGTGEEGEITSSEGLAVSGQSGRIYVSNLPGSGLSQVEIFGEEIIFVGAPTIEGQSVTEISSGSALLRAQINPNTLATTYMFEYGTSDCSQPSGGCSLLPNEGAPIGSGHQVVSVSQPIYGLDSSTTYHYRVVATNALGTTRGPDRTFRTQGEALSFRLSDGREWELVSPPHKYGGNITISTTSVLQASVDGNRLAYGTRGSTEAEPDGNRSIELSTNLAQRIDGAWVSKDLTPPHTEASALGFGSEFKLFSPDLGQAVLEPRDGTGLSPEASERTPYLRKNTIPPFYVPLVTSKEGVANVPPGTQFDREAAGDRNAVALAGANPQLDHIVLVSRVALMEGAAEDSLYEWVAGKLKPVSELPEAEGGAIVRGQLGSGFGSIANAVSSDGSRIIWNSDDPPALYLRDSEAEETIRLDTAQPGASGAGSPSPRFQGASLDGSRVFFTDGQQLTEDSSPSGLDLYVCKVARTAGHLGCESIVNLSAPRQGSGESADVRGVVSGLSDDGTQLYFVADGVLDERPNPQGESAAPAEPHLYTWLEGVGVRFIATLSPGDSPDWGEPSAGSSSAAELSADSSPSGRYLSFMSERDLTPYESLDGGTGERSEQVYVYDALADTVACASCDPFGGAAVGHRLGSGLDGQVLPDVQNLWSDRLVAATLPEATEGEPSGNSFYRPRTTLDNGRVFFNGASSLVPADSNGSWDVYQYEPLGVGSCTDSSDDAAFVRSGNGCVGLISSGSSTEDSIFLDADTSGSNAFFLSKGQLSALDEDLIFDVYDARVGGVRAVLSPQAECVGQACQSPGGTPSASIPASAIYEGQGNVRVRAHRRCPKGKRKVHRHGHVRCVPRKRHQHAQHRDDSRHNAEVAR